MSYVADHGAWAQRIQQEMSAQHRSLQHFLARRTMSKDESNNPQNNLFNNSYSHATRPQFLEQKEKTQQYRIQDPTTQYYNRQGAKQNVWKSLQQINQGINYDSDDNIIDPVEAMIRADNEQRGNEEDDQGYARLFRSNIGQRLFQMNQRIMGPANGPAFPHNATFNQVGGSGKNKLNMSGYAFGGSSSIVHSPFKRVFTNHGLNDTLNQKGLGGRSIRDQQPSQLIQSDQNASVRRSLDSRRSQIQELAQKIKQQNNHSSQKSKRVLSIQENNQIGNTRAEIYNVVEKNARSGTQSVKRLSDKPRFNENLDQEISTQKSTTFRSNITRHNLNQLAENEYKQGDEDIKSKFSSLRSQKLSQKSKRDLMSSYKDLQQSNSKNNLDRQSMNSSKIRTSLSKVRGKLIEAIRKLDKDKLKEVTEKMNIITNPNDLELLYLDDKDKLNKVEVEEDIDDDDIFVVGNQNAKPGQNQNKQEIDRVTESELKIINNFDKQSNYRGEDIDEKYYQLEQQLRQEQQMRQKLEQDISNLQKQFFNQYESQKSSKSGKSRVRNEEQQIQLPKYANYMRSRYDHTDAKEALHNLASQDGGKVLSMKSKPQS
ncbi:UNKNOWN [Stylonychia lemnae]|uniref:Uncharacterized protein n=1 Tax=Stylonychia lemnae TaxID=5949 RepID=A0A077ZQC8_STYLE|nr:UNKNOWN [Stylonychia lemnae]|eukprot:CDW71664.1 UNKNOWN [Stylonychia lemnae]